jgi:hypothetical protein
MNLIFSFDKLKSELDAQIKQFWTLQATRGATTYRRRKDIDRIRTANYFSRNRNNIPGNSKTCVTIGNYEIGKLFAVLRKAFSGGGKGHESGCHFR